MSIPLTYRALVVALVLLASAAVLCEAAISQSYELQRRIGSAGEWGTIAKLTISRHTAHSAPRLKSTPPADKDLAREEKSTLTAADLVFYRAVAEGGSAEEAVMVSITPCSIIRGFEAADSTTVVLRERLRVVVGPGTSVVGLQVTSETNFFHSKMTDGDECDLSVVEKLFPTVRMKTEVGLLPSVELKHKVNYADLRVLSGEEGKPAAKTAAKKKEIRRVKNAEGEWVEQEVEVDDRSFIQKYWIYLVIPLVMSFVQNMAGK